MDCRNSAGRSSSDTPFSGCPAGAPDRGYHFPQVAAKAELPAVEAVVAIEIVSASERGQGRAVERTDDPAILREIEPFMHIYKSVAGQTVDLPAAARAEIGHDIGFEPLCSGGPRHLQEAALAGSRNYAGVKGKCPDWNCLPQKMPKKPIFLLSAGWQSSTVVP
jgi:hypothetical protein